MRNIMLKSLVVLSALVFAFGSSSVLTAAGGPIEGGDDGQVYQHQVQGIDYVFPFTFPDAEAKAIASLNTWMNQHPNCYILSKDKKFDWVMVNGQQRSRCTITFTFEVLPWD